MDGVINKADCQAAFDKAYAARLREEYLRRDGASEEQITAAKARADELSDRYLKVLDAENEYRGRVRLSVMQAFRRGDDGSTPSR